ncbi:gamma-glutamyl-gamma-aminobutyrate hydrolase family protein [Virgibacillus sp. W0430]|uniref:gamma-glutamyl-gamma-aminobutyrate hydrolase family protein n=1 Tax=Virgibacillus sp. W0430 TaxID=3391580 RepID=UPI003F45F747
MMQPIVGVVPSVDEKEGTYFINEDNIKALSAAGGIPVLLPYTQCKTSIDKMVAMIDGLYLTGGNDIDPFHFGEEPHPHLGTVNQERDRFELKIVTEILEKKKPVFGVCKGCQIINVALGGSVYQDMYTQINKPLIQHQQKALYQFPSHNVHITEKSILWEITRSNTIKVNSRHHQSVRQLGDTLIISGVASDGVIEAIESTEDQFILGVQWHPENMIENGDKTSSKIYQAFIDACSTKV